MVKINFSNKKKFLIAEAGINHNGSLKTALDLVNTAKNNGADAIKFQTYKTEKRVNKKNKKIFKILKKCELSYKDFIKISDYCKKKKITFFSTPFDKEAVDFLETLKVPLYKVASFDISNYELLQKIIKTKKSTIVSTGMATMPEIEKVYKFFKQRKVNLSLLHCISSYPTKEEDSYLSNLRYLINKFNCTIGISDHTNGIKIPIYGALLGANIIEKHLKINEKHKCIDAPVSITGEQLRKLRTEVDKINPILNKPTFKIKLAEKNAQIFKRKKIY
jgi:sialic acid synthase SpsE